MSGKPEIMARRRTADNIGLSLWSDGSLTWWDGRAVKGSPHARTDAQRALAVDAGWLVLGEAELYEAAEIPKLVTTARKVAERGGLPGDLRTAFARAEAKGSQLKPTWTVYETDRDGHPTIRVWKLPRLLYGGLAVWDYCGKRNSVGGRYEVVREIGKTGTYGGEGFRFNDLGELSKHLHEERGRYLKTEYR